MNADRHRVVWLHFGLLAVFFALLAVASVAGSVHGRRAAPGWDDALWHALEFLPVNFFGSLPLVAGIAVGIGHYGHRGIRAARHVVVVATLAMLALDTWVIPAVQPLPEGWRVDANSVAYTPLDPNRGVIGTGAAFLTREVRGLHQDLDRYPPMHPRPVAVFAIFQARRFLLPLVLVGVVLGVGAWVRTRVIFRSRRDEVIVRWALAWMVASAASSLVGSFGVRHDDLLFRGAALWLPLVPYVPALVLALLGWRLAARSPEAPLVLDDLRSRSAEPSGSE